MYVLAPCQGDYGYGDLSLGPLFYVCVCVFFLVLFCFCQTIYFLGGIETVNILELLLKVCITPVILVVLWCPLRSLLTSCPGVICSLCPLEYAYPFLRLKYSF